MNVGSLLLLLMLVFAVLGANLFSEVTARASAVGAVTSCCPSRLLHRTPLALQVTLSGEYLNEHANFRTMQAAVLLLFRCVTGESWNGIMRKPRQSAPAAALRGRALSACYRCGSDDCMVDARLNPNRCSNEVGNCGSPPAALVYFISFALVGSFVMLNLVIAVILENFSAIGSEEDLVVPDHAIEQVSAQGGALSSLPRICHLARLLCCPVFTMRHRARFPAQYKEEWERLDPKATGNIPSSMVLLLLRRVKHPLGFAHPTKKDTAALTRRATTRCPNDIRCPGMPHRRHPHHLLRPPPSSAAGASRCSSSLASTCETTADSSTSRSYCRLSPSLLMTTSRYPSERQSQRPCILAA